MFRQPFSLSLRHFQPTWKCCDKKTSPALKATTTRDISLNVVQEFSFDMKQDSRVGVTTIHVDAVTIGGFSSTKSCQQQMKRLKASCKLVRYENNNELTTEKKTKCNLVISFISLTT